MSTLSTIVTDDEITAGIKDEFGVVYSADGKRLLKCENEKLESYEIKDGTVEIASNAFHSCGIKKITLCDSLIVIGFAAFRFCKNLEEITLPNSLEHLGGYTFYGCSQLHTIHINGTFSWNDAWFNKNPFDDHWGYFNPFGYMESIKHFTNTNPNFVVEGGTLYNAEKTVLFRCSTLNREIHIPKTVEYILDFAFCNCKYLQNVELPAKLWFLGKSAFSDCKSIREIAIPSTIKDIPEMCFSLCTKLAHLKLHKKISYICDDAFMGCDELEFIDFPRGHEKRLYQLLIDSGYEPLINSPLRYTEYCEEIKLMFDWNGFVRLKTIATNDVNLIIQGEKTIVGIDEVIKELTNRFPKADSPEKRIATTIVKHNNLNIDYINIHNIRSSGSNIEVRSLMMLFYIVEDKITTIVLGNDLYGIRHQRPMETIDVKKNSIPSIPNQQPCMKCGTLSEKLKWVTISDDGPMGGRRGIMSICPYCNKQIQYRETMHYIANRY